MLLRWTTDHGTLVRDDRGTRTSLCALIPTSDWNGRTVAPFALCLPEPTALHLEGDITVHRGDGIGDDTWHVTLTR